MRSRPALLVLSLLPLLAWRCVVPGTHVFAIAFGERAATWERFDTVGNVWGDYANAFDPNEVALTGEFQAPGGEVLAMPGFLTQDFDRVLVGGFEHLTARGPRYWTVRFTPPEPGAWRWRWVVTTRGASATTGWHDLTVEPPKPGRHGFLRPSPLDPRYLRFDDGTPYVAIGENVGWYDGRGSFAYDDWFAKLAAQGANFARLWMSSWAFGLEWIRRAPDGSLASSSLGDYGERLDRAWQLDRVLEEAERRGIHVMLSLQNHGAFSTTTNPEWGDNPYNAVNGGPLATPAEVFTSPAARELFRRRLRYVVARWGWSTNVLAWELWNEVDAVGLGPATDAWHVEMAQWLDALDPYHHPVTTSLARGAPSSLWALPGMDLVQIHHYAFPLGLDVPTVVGVLMSVHATTYPGKPLLLSEYGVDYRGPAETIANDPEAIGFHHGLWAGLLTGGFGTGMSWWWDNVVDPENLYSQLGPIAAWVDGIAFDAQGFAPLRPTVSAAGRSLAAYALRGRSVVLAWVQNTGHQWLLAPLPGPDPVPVTGGTLVLAGLADGVWTARWSDPWTGGDLAAHAVTVSGGTATLAVPTFARDVALRLERGE